jgi:hypothetical protein
LFPSPSRDYIVASSWVRPVFSGSSSVSSHSNRKSEFAPLFVLLANNTASACIYSSVPESSRVGWGLSFPTILHGHYRRRARFIRTPVSHRAQPQRPHHIQSCRDIHLTSLHFLQQQAPPPRQGSSSGKWKLRPSSAQLAIRSGALPRTASPPP